MSKKTSKDDFEVWFLKSDGQMMSQNYPWLLHQRPNDFLAEKAKDFTDELTYDGMDGGSHCRVHWKSAKSGLRYLMFIGDFDEIIKANKFIDKKIDGTFRFVRHGSAQGIKLILPPAQP